MLTLTATSHVDAYIAQEWSGLWLTILFSRAAGQAAKPLCPGSRTDDLARSRRRTGWGHSPGLWGLQQDWCSGGCVGRSASSHTFWASLNSCCRNAHLDTTFSKIGRKRNNGGEGGGHRKKHTHTQTKINFWSLLWNHNKGPAECFITSSWGKTPGIIFYLAVILLHYSFSQVFQHVCRSESTNTKTFMYRYTWKSAELTQLRHVSKCLH